jgi:hypothetical protein
MSRVFGLPAAGDRLKDEAGVEQERIAWALTYVLGVR